MKSAFVLDTSIIRQHSMAEVVEEEEGKKMERRRSNDNNKNETQHEINSNTIVVSDSVNRGTEGKLPACQPGQRTPPSS